MAERPARQLLLASASPYRRKMLEAAGARLQVVAADVDEAALKRELAAAHAASRPRPSRARRWPAPRPRPSAPGIPTPLVIGADQVLALGDELLDKPGDLAAARAQLAAPARQDAPAASPPSRWREGGKARLDACGRSARSPCAPSAMPSSTATSPRPAPRICRIVGAYEIEGRGIQLFERVEGDHFTIIGLPLLPLLAELRSRGVIAT